MNKKTVKFWRRVIFPIAILFLFEIVNEVLGNPRCGTTDEMMVDRAKRFVLHGVSWASKNLTYRVSKYTNQLSEQEVDDALRKAFNKWSQYTELKFTQLNPEEVVDIDVRFEKGDHDDGYPFDGPGKELAHGFYGGDLHFDDEEKWSVSGKKNDGISLYTVAVHEIGHSLGLRHSDIRKALMAPYYDPKNQDGTLHQDDINGIQEIYGKKKMHFDLDLCINPLIDTIFTTFDGKFYLFKGDHYYQIRGKYLVDGPNLINETWIGLPSKIEAAFYYPPTNRTYFFKESSYWRFNHTKMDAGYPQFIPDSFPSIPSHLDDAMVWDVDGKVYFFKGSKFHRVENPFTEDKKIEVSISTISSFWKRIPNHIDAVFTNADNITYFFKDDEFYDYLGRGKLEDVSKFSVKSYLTIDYWYNCTNTDSLFTRWWKKLKRKFKNDFRL